MKVNCCKGIFFFFVNCWVVVFFGYGVEEKRNEVKKNVFKLWLKFELNGKCLVRVNFILNK